MNPDSKTVLRRKMKALLKQHPPQTLSPAFFDALKQFAPYRSAVSVLLYAALPEEAPTRSIIDFCLADNKITAIPKTAGNNMDFFILDAGSDFEAQTESGIFGIAEPRPPCRIFTPSKETFPILVFIPGLAFDSAGGRLGRGGGYYDRYCAYLNKAAAGSTDTKNALTYAGYCRSIQIVSRIPAETHDLKLDFLISENGIYVCTKKAAANDHCAFLSSPTDRI